MRTGFLCNKHDYIVSHITLNFIDFFFFHLFGEFGRCILKSITMLALNCIRFSDGVTWVYLSVCTCVQVGKNDTLMHRGACERMYVYVKASGVRILCLFM